MNAPGMRWAEPVTALIMAMAALGTAWSSYQSAAWTRRSQRLMIEFNSLERRAGVLTVQGTQTAAIHVALFTQALAAQQAGHTETNKQAEAHVGNARAAGTISGQYLANTVLVFANAAIKFQQRIVRVVSFYFSIAVFAFVTFRLILLPI
jgi:hypothetical protein